MISKKTPLSADAERRAYAKNQAVAILHTLINHLHVDGAYYVDKPCPTILPSGAPLLTVQLSAEVPRYLFEHITHWDADADPDLDGSDDDEREPCVDRELESSHD